MLRIFKWKSPMSMGVWGLIAFSAPATAAAAAQLARDGVLPRADFALPRAALAHESAATRARRVHLRLHGRALERDGESAVGRRQAPHPAISVCSGVAGACALNNLMLALFGGNESTRRNSSARGRRRLAELAVLFSFRRHAGAARRADVRGPRGREAAQRDDSRRHRRADALNLIPVHARWKTALSIDR
jgi:hypothetical protein